jgi:hypothetical protein
MVGVLVESGRMTVQVDVDDRVNLQVAVKLEVWVDVEVVVHGATAAYTRRAGTDPRLSDRRRLSGASLASCALRRGP